MAYPDRDRRLVAEGARWPCYTGVKKVWYLKKARQAYLKNILGMSKIWCLDEVQSQENAWHL